MKLKRLIITMLVLAAATLSIQAVEISASAGADFVSKYVWRGFLLSDGANTQPAVEVGFGNFYVGYWGSVNWDVDDYNLEQDIYIGYDFTIDDAVGISIGFTHYEFPSIDGKSDEFWLGISLDEVPLAPSLTLYYDIGDEDDGGADGYYVLLSAGHDFEIADGVTLGLSAGLGYNDELFVDEKGIADFVPSISLGWEINEHFSFSVSANYSTVVDSDLEEAMGADNESWAVISFSVA